METIPMRLKTYRRITCTNWLDIAQKTGLSIDTLKRCEKDVFTDTTAHKLLSFLEKVEEETTMRRLPINSLQRPGILRYASPAARPGTIIMVDNEPQLVVHCRKDEHLGIFIQTGIFIPDESLEPRGKMGQFVGVHPLINIQSMSFYSGYYYLIVDRSLKTYLGEINECLCCKRVEVRYSNKKYPSVFLKRSTIIGAFQVIL